MKVQEISHLVNMETFPFKMSEGMKIYYWYSTACGVGKGSGGCAPFW